MNSTTVVEDAKNKARELAPLSNAALGVAMADYWEDIYWLAGNLGYGELMKTHFAELALATVRSELEL